LPVPPGNFWDSTSRPRRPISFPIHVSSYLPTPP
jgi:hypothetical protein